MLSLDADTLNLINGEKINFVNTVELDFNTPVYGTTAPFDLTISGKTYDADFPLGLIAVPNAQSEINRDLYSIKISDSSKVYYKRLQQENTGISMTISALLANPTDINYSHKVDIFTGKIINFEEDVQTNVDGTYTRDTIVQGAGQFKKLEQIRVRNTTESSQKSVHSNDTAFDHSFDTENKASKQWGGLGGR